MTAIIAILRAVAVPVLAGGVISGLLALWYTVTAGQFILWCIAALVIVFAALLTAFIPLRGHRDDDGDAMADADEYMEPLRRPGDAEKTLTTDLRQRRMLLRPRGLTEARAAQLNRQALRRTMRDRISREAPQRGRHAAPPRAPRSLAGVHDAATETLAAIPSMPAALPPAVAYTPTEPVPVRLAEAMKPDTAYPDWPTGQFAAVIDKAGDSGGAA